MKYNPRKNIEVSFLIRESLYFRFRTLCKDEKILPSTALKQLIQNYVEERENKNDKG